MKLNWRKPALWAALTAATVGAVAIAAEADGPDVVPTYFALPLQPATGNPVTCMENSGSSLGLGYPMGVKLDGKGTGTWDIYLPLDETGGGTAVASGGPAPGGGLAFAGTIVVSDVVGDSNAINFANSGTFLGVSGVIITAGSGGDPQSSSVYPYEQPPASVPVAGPNNDLTDYGWPNPYPGGFPGPQIEDDGLDIGRPWYERTRQWKWNRGDPVCVRSRSWQPQHLDRVDEQRHAVDGNHRVGETQDR